IRLLAENAGDHRNHISPFRGLRLELARTGPGERVKAGAAVVLRFTPLAGDLLDAQQDAIAMQRPKRDRLENEHLECALREFNWFRHWLKGSLLSEKGEYTLSPFPSRRATQILNFVARPPKPARSIAVRRK